jgi:RND family efflux transporter MFP subunit
MTVMENNMKTAKINISKTVKTVSGISVVLTIILASAFFSGCGKKEEQKAEKPVIRGLETYKSRSVEIDRIYETAGSVKPNVVSNVSSRLMGAIISIEVREGDAVKQGQLLAAIDDSDIRQKVRAAEMGLETASSNRSLAEATYKRYAGMYSEKAVTAQEMDQIEAAKKSADSEYLRARAMLMEAKTFLGYSRIASPITGHVTKKMADEGSMASPGMPLMTVESDDNHIEASVDESLAGIIKTDTPVEVLTSGKATRAHIKTIVPSVDPATRTFMIKVLPDDQQLMSGQFVKIGLKLGKRRALTVPQSALINRGGLTGVYTVNPEGVISFRIVKTGTKTPSGVEVISGLSAGEMIIAGGVELAVDGAVMDRGTAK